jgi:hypothetical protein
VSHPAPTYGLVWGAIHIVTSDDTNHGSGALAYIAANSTRIMQTTQHMPTSMSVSASAIASHNGLASNAILHIGQQIKLPSYERTN